MTLVEEERMCGSGSPSLKILDLEVGHILAYTLANVATSNSKEDWEM